MAYFDLTNQIIGDFKVLRTNDSDASGHKIWECECMKCGEISRVRSTDLIHKRKTTCTYCSGKRLKKDNSQKTNTSKINDNLFDITTDVDLSQYSNIKLIEENLLNVPIIYKVAQAINADLSFSPKGLTGLMNKYFNIGEQLLDYVNVEWETGDVIPTGSVYNLLTKNNKDDCATYDNVKLCLENLRDICYRDNTKYLAIPKIGCGRDKLNFTKVLYLICDIFGNTDIQVCVFGDYSNDPDYDVDYLGSLLQNLD